jgi:hypothetical protein
MTIEYGSMMLQGQQELSNHRRAREMFQAASNHAPTRHTSFDFPGYLVGNLVFYRRIQIYI